MQRFNANQYNFQLAAGVATKITPANAKRVYLAFFNRSPNELQLQFARPANNPTDIVIIGFDSLVFDTDVPIDGFGLYSVLGGNVVVVEGNAL